MSPRLGVALRGLAAVLGLTEIGLGALLWTGRGYALLPVHIVVGFAITGLLLVAAWAGLRAGASRGRVALAAGWAIGLPIFGLVHAEFFPGAYHGVVRAAHLAVGIAALAQVGLLSAVVERAPREVAPRVAPLQEAR